MKSALKSIENLDKALKHLETAVDKRLQAMAKKTVEPQLDLSSRNEREVNKKVAARLDQTIERLESVLGGE